MRSTPSSAIARAGSSPRRAFVAAGAVAGGAVAVLVLLAAIDALTVPRLPDPSLVANRRADCLWYAARNHGFLPLQREVVRAFDRGRRSNAEAAVGTDRVAWDGFVQTIGAHECGAIGSVGLDAVLTALAATADDADRLLLGKVR